MQVIVISYFSKCVTGLLCKRNVHFPLQSVQNSRVTDTTPEYFNELTKQLDNQQSSNEKLRVIYH